MISFKWCLRFSQDSNDSRDSVVVAKQTRSLGLDILSLGLDISWTYEKLAIEVIDLQVQSICT